MPPPNARIGYSLPPPDQQWYASISGCGDRLARDFDVDIDTVEHWTGDAFLVFCNESRSTRTCFLCIIEPPAWTMINSTVSCCSARRKQQIVSCQHKRDTLG